MKKCFLLLVLVVTAQAIAVNKDQELYDQFRHQSESFTLGSWLKQLFNSDKKQLSNSDKHRLRAFKDHRDFTLWLSKMKKDGIDGARALTVTGVFCLALSWYMAAHADNADNGAKKSIGSLVIGSMGVLSVCAGVEFGRWIGYLDQMAINAPVCVSKVEKELAECRIFLLSTLISTFSTLVVAYY